MNDVLNTYKDVIIKGAVMLGIVAAGAVVLLYPIYQDVISMDDQIAEANTQLDRQQVFAPEYQVFEGMSQKGIEMHFDVPKPEPVPVRDIDIVPEKVQQLAEAAGMKVLDVVISPSSLRKGDGKLMLQAIAIGDMAEFQSFYTSLGSWGGVYRVSMLEVQATAGGVQYFLELWVYIAEKAG